MTPGIIHSRNTKDGPLKEENQVPGLPLRTAEEGATAEEVSEDAAPVGEATAIKGTTATEVATAEEVIEAAAPVGEVTVTEEILAIEEDTSQEENIINILIRITGVGQKIQSKTEI